MKKIKGKFTTTLKSDSDDIFFDIMTSLMKAFHYDKKELNTSYIVDANNHILLVMVNDVNVAIICKMEKCEKVLYEPLSSKINIMAEYGIKEEEWDKMMAHYPYLDIKEPMKSVYEYDIWLMAPTEYDDYIDAATELLKELC